MTGLEEEGGVETEITKRVGAVWSNWKKCKGVFCLDDTYNTIRMERLEEGIWDSVGPNNKPDGQGESKQDGCKTSNDVQYRDMGSDESIRDEVECGGN